MSIKRIEVKTKALSNHVWRKYHLTYDASSLRIYLEGKNVVIQFIDRDLVITHLQVDITKLTEKKKITTDQRYLIPAKYDTVEIRIVNSNDEFAILNILEAAFSDRPMPMIHDQEGFQSLIPKNYIGSRRDFRRVREDDNRPTLNINIISAKDGNDKKGFFSQARQFASGIALAMQIHLDFVNIQYQTRYRGGRYMSAEFMDIMQAMSESLREAGIELTSDHLIDLISYIEMNLVDAKKLRKHPRGYEYEEDEFFY